MRAELPVLCSSTGWGRATTIPLRSTMPIARYDMCAITLTKVREQTRFHMRQKRGLAQEVHAAQDSASSAIPVAAPGPTPAQAAEFADQLERLLAGLDEEERKIVDLKLQDYTQEEIAQQLNCSERTVRRILKRLQARLLRDFE